VTTPYFDEALGVLIETFRRSPMTAQVRKITVVRDPVGRLTTVLGDDVMADAAASKTLASLLHQALGVYSPGQAEILLRESDLLDPGDVLDSPDKVFLGGLSDTPFEVYLVDRLLTNLDWLRKPLHRESQVPVGVGYSLKGGVGRSSALAVLAWYLARQGKNVVIIDLDLEAPGLGAILLENSSDRGAVDWLVESLAGNTSDEFLRDCLTPSPVANGEAGSIAVMPAFGQRTADYIPKIGRIYLPTISEDGRECGLADRLAELLATLDKFSPRPDAILLDARAGLHDLAAAAVTRLNAEVFLFARDEEQSWSAHRQLFCHLARSPAVSFGMPDDDLRWRMKMVAAQIDVSEAALTRWVERSYEAWIDLYDDETAGDEARSFARDETNAPHFPMLIYFNSELRGFVLSEPERRPSWSVLENAFGPFLREATARLLSGAGENGRS
jgi:cellulose biosynthesis protein BcsQ